METPNASPTLSVEAPKIQIPVESTHGDMECIFVCCRCCRSHRELFSYNPETLNPTTRKKHYSRAIWGAFPQNWGGGVHIDLLALSLCTKGRCRHPSVHR